MCYKYIFILLLSYLLSSGLHMGTPQQSPGGPQARYCLRAPCTSHNTPLPVPAVPWPAICQQLLLLGGMPHPHCRLPARAPPTRGQACGLAAPPSLYATAPPSSHGMDPPYAYGLQGREWQHKESECGTSCKMLQECWYVGGYCVYACMCVLGGIMCLCMHFVWWGGPGVPMHACVRVGGQVADAGQDAGPGAGVHCHRFLNLKKTANC